MDEDHTAKRLEAVRASLDDAAKYVGNLYLTFLLASVYIAIAVGSTNDEQLLRESNLPLPLLGVGLPIKTFYLVIPVVLVLLHLHLLLHVYFLSRKAVDFENMLQGQALPVEQEQKRLLFPLIISPITARAYPSVLIRSSLRIVTWSTVIAGPVLLLLFVQVRFLPFHAVSISLWQRAFLLIDLMALWLIWWRISRMPTGAKGKWGHIRTVSGWCVAGVTTALALIFSFCIASVPKEPLEPEWSFLEPYRKALHRNIELTDKTLVAEPPPVQLLTHYLQQGYSEEEAWRKHAKGIPLRGRDLRGINLSFSRLYNADFRGSNLDDSTFVESTLEGARFDEAHDGNGHASLKGANLASARMRGARLAEAELDRASLEGTDLCGVDLDMANLAGAFLRYAKMNGASLEAARLEAAYAPDIELKGAHLSRAHLQVAVLTHGDLRGAELGRTELQGAHLVEAKLQGADFEDANVSGADMDGADLQLSNLQELRIDPLSAADVTDLKQNLSVFLDAPKAENALKRLGIPANGIPTRFKGANFKDSFYDKKLSETIKGLPSLLQNEEYLQKLVPFLIQLGCTDSCVRKSLIARAGIRFSRLEVLLAEGLLRAKRDRSCPGLGQMSDEDSRTLQDAINRANPLYRDPIKSWP